MTADARLILSDKSVIHAHQARTDQIVSPQDNILFQLKLGVVPVLRSLLSLRDLELETSPCLSLAGFTREAVIALLTFIYRGSVGEQAEKLAE